ncbi:hypothetical protein SAMN05192533_106175 [Mesobacillus persicus]|uniref:DUF309 domain-containing protein n=1 Tax=Mesobacillus persicus TaxID=930146 RepID=A0A1H8BV40_9BACI|nr:hypothetical protein SAMN05192533_106175 [Mesobacillus persicus]
MVPKAFIQYLVHFHGDRDYFECHEILEEYWKEKDPGNKESIWVAFIQLAVSQYHYRRGNYSGALRTHDKAAMIFSNEGGKCQELGINYQALLELLVERRTSILARTPYKSMNLPLSDKSIINQCRKFCLQQGLIWGRESNILDQSLINRHSTRDRSDVILERKLALEKRKKRKGSDF